MFLAGNFVYEREYKSKYTGIARQVSFLCIVNMVYNRDRF